MKIDGEATVCIEHWQMECCGDPFKIGDRVEWTAVKGVPFNDILDVGAIDYWYENHFETDGNVFIITGTVVQITLIYYYYELNTDQKTYFPTSGILAETNQADTCRIDDKDGARFAEYCVKLKDVSVEKYEDVNLKRQTAKAVKRFQAKS
jgi:hypothetical protein